ncbi:MAG: hypothetical protein SNJ78_00720 [Spirochaetales bacterium]
MLKVAFLHYHAKPGGVTRVIEQQMQALREDADCILLAGNGGFDQNKNKVLIVPGVGYDGVRSEEPPKKTAEEIIKALQSRWPSGCDVLHVHNPLLRKNRDFLTVLNILKERGVRLFLQIHDTAEDLRPASYYFNDEYPEDCHYAVINARDYSIFLKAGLKPEGLHLLPNSVAPLVNVSTPINQEPSIQKPAKWFLYAVRAIRRKNIGEALLLSCFLPEPFLIGITLPPTSPSDYPSYEQWKAFALSEHLSIQFELGLQFSLEELIQDTYAMVTTSVREGFGFAFLESWTAFKPLVGRRIPHVAEDFTHQGVDLSTLYPEFLIPLDEISEETAKARWSWMIRETFAQYGLTIDEDLLNLEWKNLTREGSIDFPYLHPTIAREFIRRCKAEENLKSRLCTLNPFLGDLLSVSEKMELIRSNREAILRAYSLKKYRERLLDLYKIVQTKEVSQKINKRELLKSFLEPKGFYLGGM